MASKHDDRKTVMPSKFCPRCHGHGLVAVVNPKDPRNAVMRRCPCTWEVK